ncbi:MAG: ABC transporter ATP-binding protein [Crocinitomicaceae bacterium]|jgi:lipopolysaccharide transport system ATP-binding protein|nr:ABC transporter ATP-binding protein [Crocinitomicaceae bacterium]
MQVIKVENLFKQYQLGQVSTGTISHDLNRWMHKIRGKEDPYEKITGENAREEKGNSNYVWALKDINFDVKQGEVLGIIGRNGAGKSTLLKILSKVTAPSKGTIKIRGRIASLLEVGTGFHPELTGRENIFLNGAILGMTKSEIRSKFDEIVAFSGVEKYIDTPVKRYSSGMYVRLAFAVAAHLEPEILIVDEVLAVGDAEFQKKCLGKMKDVSNQGRTVIFVSHNLVAVKSLCKRGILMERGGITFMGSADETVEHYMKVNAEQLNPSISFENPTDAPGNELIKIKTVSVQPTNPFITDEISIHFSFWNFSDDPSIFLAFDLIDLHEEVVFGSGFKFEKNEANLCQGSCIIPKDLLNDGVYTINLYFNSAEMRPLFNTMNAISFEVADKERNYAYFGKINGAVRPKLKWISE